MSDISSGAAFYKNRQWKSRMQSLQTTVCISQLKYKHGISPTNGKLTCLCYIAPSILIILYNCRRTRPQRQHPLDTPRPHMGYDIAQMHVMQNAARARLECVY